VIPQKQILPKHFTHNMMAKTNQLNHTTRSPHALLFNWYVWYSGTTPTAITLSLATQLLCDLSNNVTGLLWILCTNYTTIKGQLFEQIDNKNPRVSIRLPGKLSNGTSYVAAKYVVDGWSSAFCKQNLFLFIQPRWQLKRTISLITIMFCFNEFAFTV